MCWNVSANFIFLIEIDIMEHSYYFIAVLFVLIVVERMQRQN